MNAGSELVIHSDVCLGQFAASTLTCCSPTCKQKPTKSHGVQRIAHDGGRDRRHRCADVVHGAPVAVWTAVGTGDEGNIYGDTPAHKCGALVQPLNSRRLGTQNE